MESQRAPLADITQVEIDGNLPIIIVMQALASAGLTLVQTKESTKLRIVQSAACVVQRSRQFGRSHVVERLTQQLESTRLAGLTGSIVVDDPHANAINRVQP